jgi:hypothetical protein
MLERLGDFFVAIFTYYCMAWARIRRYPRAMLVLSLLLFGSYCVFHAFDLPGNQPFFSIAGLACTLVATPLVLLYEDETKPRRRPDILSTEDDWFSQRERGRV